MSKIIIVTGGNKGIGRGCVQKLLVQAPQFETIILTSRTSALGHQTVSQIQSSIPCNGRLIYHQLDILDQASIEAFKSWFSNTYGEFDVLLNNAGVATKGNGFDRDIAEFTLRTNFFALVDITEALLPLAKPIGHIVNVTSHAGQAKLLKGQALRNQILNPNLGRQEMMDLANDFIEAAGDGSWQAKGWARSTYVASKNLANAYTRVLARELAESGSRVRVNAVHPGWIRTDMAGPTAPNDIEYGARGPVLVSRLEEWKSGRFWYETNEIDWV